MLQVKEIPLDSIIPKPQFARTQYDDQKQQDLVASIRQVGLLYPLITLDTPDGPVLVAGYRRYNAAKEIRLPTAPCILLQCGTDDAEIMRLHENLFREDISPLAEAQSLHRLEHTYHFTRDKIAKMLGKSKGYVTQRLQVLEWPEALKDALGRGYISYSVARELSLVTEEAVLLSLLDQCINSGATVRTVLTWVKQWQADQAEHLLLLSQPNQSTPPDDTATPTVTCYLCNCVVPQSDAVAIHLCLNCNQQFTQDTIIPTK